MRIIDVRRNKFICQLGEDEVTLCLANEEASQITVKLNGVPLLDSYSISYPTSQPLTYTFTPTIP